MIALHYKIYVYFYVTKSVREVTAANLLFFSWYALWSRMDNCHTVGRNSFHFPDLLLGHHWTRQQYPALRREDSTSLRTERWRGIYYRLSLYIHTSTSLPWKTDPSCQHVGICSQAWKWLLLIQDHHDTGSSWSNVIILVQLHLQISQTALFWQSRLFMVSSAMVNPSFRREIHSKIW